MACLPLPMGCGRRAGRSELGASALGTQVLGNPQTHISPLLALAHTTFIVMDDALKGNVGTRQRLHH
jgi:hypothetical protein